MWDLFLIHDLLPRVLDQHPPPLLLQVPFHLCFTLTSTCSFHSTPTNPSPAAPNPGSPLARGTAHTPRPELQSSAVKSQLCSHPYPTPLICGWLWYPQPVHTRSSLPTTPSPLPYHPPRLSRPTRPVQASPPPGSLLRFHHATGPSDSPRTWQGLSRSCHSCLASSSSFLSLPSPAFVLHLAP